MEEDFQEAIQLEDFQEAIELIENAIVKFKSSGIPQFAVVLETLLTILYDCAGDEFDILLDVCAITLKLLDARKSVQQKMVNFSEN